MDRITKSLLGEFAGEASLTDLPENSQFEHFASYLTIGRHVGEALVTEDVVIGSGADTGIDAVATIVNGSLATDEELVSQLADQNGYLDVTVVFVQAERSSGFESGKIGQFGYGVVDFFSEDPKLPRNTAVEEAAKAMAAVFDKSSKFKRGNPICPRPISPWSRSRGDR